VTPSTAGEQGPAGIPRAVPPAGPVPPAATGSAAEPLTIAYLGDANSIHVRRWASHFSALGHRITLLVPSDQVVSPGLPDAIAIERFVPHTAHRLRQLGMLDTRRSLRRALARVDPDVLHAHHLTVNGMRAWMSGFHPYAVTVWGSDVLVTVRRSVRARIFARLSLHSADLVTGISGHLVRAAVAAGARPERSRVLHFGVDLARFAAGPDPAALRDRLGLVGRRVLFSPRTIAPLYRQATVVDALARLPQDVALVMTRHNANGAELERIEARIAERGLTGRVVIVPSVAYEEMSDFYRLADVVVSVPESDAGPITLVEALAVGRPTVCSDLPPVHEWLDDLDPSAIVPLGDVGATAAAVERMLARDPAERADFARRGRRAVEERADQTRCMAEMEALYRELAARRKRRG
jgi:glycosyltransferase involved in cell wall biosynthesis